MQEVIPKYRMLKAFKMLFSIVNEVEVHTFETMKKTEGLGKWELHVVFMGSSKRKLMQKWQWTNFFVISECHFFSRVYATAHNICTWNCICSDISVTIFLLLVWTVTLYWRKIVPVSIHTKHWSLFECPHVAGFCFHLQQSKFHLASGLKISSHRTIFSHAFFLFTFF